MLDAKKIILIQENASAKRGSSQIDEATYKQHTGCIVLTQDKKILLYSNQFVFRQGGK